MNEKTDEKEIEDQLEENPRSCATCYFAQEIEVIQPGGNTIIGQKQMVCMQGPPTPVAINQKTPLGDQTGIVSQYPPVNAQMFCYQYWPVDVPYLEPDDPDNYDLVTGLPLRKDN